MHADTGMQSKASNDREPKHPQILGESLSRGWRVDLFFHGFHTMSTELSMPHAASVISSRHASLFHRDSERPLLSTGFSRRLQTQISSLRSFGSHDPMFPRSNDAHTSLLLFYIPVHKVTNFHSLNTPRRP